MQNPIFCLLLIEKTGTAFGQAEHLTRLWNKCTEIVLYTKLLGVSYGYSNYEEWIFGIVISAAKENKGGIAIASKFFVC